MPLADDHTARCGACLRKTPPYARTITLGDYAPPLSGLITGLKYRAQLPTASWLAHRLAAAVRALPPSERPTVLLPVPLSAVRLRERGFNQAWEIARRVGSELGCATNPHGLQRHRDTTPQTGLPLKARRANLRGAFTLFTLTDEKSIENQHVGIVDDVMTTGATLHEIARVLRRHGARQVTAIAALRTPR